MKERNLDACGICYDQAKQNGGIAPRGRGLGNDCCGKPLWLEEPVNEATLTTEGAPLPGPFTIKDSGKRETVGSGGMVRDTEEGKVDFTLVLDGPMFERWGIHLTKGARKYTARNWMKCVHPNATRAELEASAERFKRSLARHWVQYMRGDQDEDHAAAVMFNINGLEYVRDALAKLAAP